MTKIPKKFEDCTHSSKRPQQKNRNAEAFYEQVKDGTQGRFCDKLYAVIDAYGHPLTRKMAARFAKMDSNQITQYVKILILEGKLLESKTKAPCAISGRNAYWLKVANPKPKQLEINDQTKSQ